MSKWKTLRARIEGKTPILLNNSQTVDPLNEYSVKMKKINSIHHSKKTEMHHRKLRRLDWESRLYLDDDRDVMIPAENLYRCIQSNAPSGKKKTFIKAFDVIANAKLIHDGPVDLDRLYKQTKFVDERKVVVKGGGSVIRSRPRFDKWSVEFDMIFNPELVGSVEVLREAIVTAGEEGGLGDYRPRFGRFELVSLEEIT